MRLWSIVSNRLANLSIDEPANDNRAKDKRHNQRSQSAHDGAQRYIGEGIKTGV
jgi:hypothetical protein